MKSKQSVTLFIVILSVICVSSVLLTTAQAETVPSMSKEDLKSMLGNPELVILDVRSGRDWKSSEFKIKGAIRIDPEKVDSWVSAYSKDKKFVLYCA
jgi:predicted sulfurtransferase